jgi:phosphopantothenoylcysteine decarboxylase / phosphopantothenate---cysteine ligase
LLADCAAACAAREAGSHFVVVLPGWALHNQRAMDGPKILLIVGGGIAAYKSCELVRLIRQGSGTVTCVLTKGGAQFVTAMTLAALSENPVHTTLWDLTSEVEMGHIQLSRAADLVVVCPATADLLAKMAAGIADDLATTLLLATDKPVLAVPAMNVRMWQHAATQRNVEVLRQRGVSVLDPDSGIMACGEFGPGRLPEPPAIWAAICAQLGLPEPALGDEVPQSEDTGLGGLAAGLIQRSTATRVLFEDQILPPGAEVLEPLQPAPQGAAGLVPAIPVGPPLVTQKGLAKAAPPTDPDAINHLVAAPGPGPLAEQPDFEAEPAHRPLFGKHVLVTAGPTHEAIDPVRYIANRSSGKQGFAIAAAAARAGARVTLVAGPVALDTPLGVERIDVESAREMAEAVKLALPADVAVMVAAVADWRTSDYVPSKMKKRGSAPPALRLTENPDILASVAGGGQRPRLLIGFAAETDDVLKHAQEKRLRKGADWIVANDVSGGIGHSVMGGDANRVHIVTASGVESLPELPKDQVAAALVERIARALVE